MFSCILMARVCKLVSSLLFCRGLSVHPLHLHKCVNPLHLHKCVILLNPLLQQRLLSGHSHTLLSLPSILYLQPQGLLPVLESRSALTSDSLALSFIWGKKVLGLLLCLRNNGNSLWKTSILHQKGKWETCWARIPQIRVCY